jgi:DNA/RNA endonuclease YhcR with UshA esterase domain
MRVSMDRSIRCVVCLVAVLFLVTVSAEFARAQHHLTASEAHVRETATVCGEVVSTRYAASTKGHPTFLNLDKPYPGQIFTILIWGEARGKFGEPEETYRGKHACVTGHISEYRGVPEIVVSEASQLTIEGK